MDFILGLVFFLCLMFLTMLFGERLSLFGVIDNRWLTAPFDAAADFWDLICEATDRLWCFVLDHFWWVTAAVSGSIGILLIAFIMVSGLTSQAQAVRHDESSRLHVGSVLDNVPVLQTRRQLAGYSFPTGTSISAPSQLVYQVPSNNRYHVPASISQPIVRDIPSERFIPPSTFDVPAMELTRPRYTEPVISRSRLSLSLEPFVERAGHRVSSPELAQLIRQTLATLRNDDWAVYSSASKLTRSAPREQELPQDAAADVARLESLVRIIPGRDVTESDLLIEKSVPDNVSDGSFSIQIRVTNRSQGTLSGLIVRELLPASWKVVDLQPRGIYRESAVTWLVDRLLPESDEVLTVTVRCGETGRYQCYTEVSAVSAVMSPSDVARDFRREPLPSERVLPEIRPMEETISSRPIRPPERTLPPVVSRPEVELTLEKIPQSVRVGEWVDVRFRVKNVGTAPAEGVSLRVELPLGLDHRTLTDSDLDRRVDSNVRRLDVGESREMVLAVRPTNRGRHFAIAELVLQDEQLDLRDFELVAREDSVPTDSAPRPRPTPDFR
ncbi:MAG: DUF11 domain-containing protein [Planctomycetaceae bacterium]|nr:DUF11 domain-containing protein [Planctomycetaceae bacterium]